MINFNNDFKSDEQKKVAREMVSKRENSVAETIFTQMTSERQSVRSYLRRITGVNCLSECVNTLKRVATRVYLVPFFPMTE